MNTIITRNNVAKQLSKSTFGKTSDHSGKEFYYPEVTEASFDKDVEWLSKSEAANILDKEMRSIFMDIYLDNVYASDNKNMPTPADHPELEGTLNEAQWELDAAEFTAGVAKLGELNEQLDVLQAEQQKYALDPVYEFGETLEDGVTPTEQAKKTQELIKEVNLKIKPLRVKRATIAAKYEARAEARKAKKAKLEAAQRAKMGASELQTA